MSTSKSVFPCSCATNTLMKYSLTGSLIYWYLPSQFSSLRRPDQRVFSFFSFASFCDVLIYFLLIQFISQWMFHRRLHFSWCNISCNYKQWTFPGSLPVAFFIIRLSGVLHLHLVSLVDGMAVLPTLSVRCENCEFLSRSKTQGLNFRE